jgi:hypothetical protein
MHSIAKSKPVPCRCIAAARAVGCFALNTGVVQQQLVRNTDFFCLSRPGVEDINSRLVCSAMFHMLLIMLSASLQPFLSTDSLIASKSGRVPATLQGHCRPRVSDRGACFPFSKRPNGSAPPRIHLLRPSLPSPLTLIVLILNPLAATHFSFFTLTCQCSAASAFVHSHVLGEMQAARLA